MVDGAATAASAAAPRLWQVVASRVREKQLDFVAFLRAAVATSAGLGGGSTAGLEWLVGRHAQRHVPLLQLLEITPGCDKDDGEWNPLRIEFPSFNLRFWGNSSTAVPDGKQGTLNVGDVVLALLQLLADSEGSANILELGHIPVNALHRPVLADLLLNWEKDPPLADIFTPFETISEGPVTACIDEDSAIVLCSVKEAEGAASPAVPTCRSLSPELYKMEDLLTCADITPLPHPQHSKSLKQLLVEICQPPRELSVLYSPQATNFSAAYSRLAASNLRKKHSLREKGQAPQKTATPRRALQLSKTSQSTKCLYNFLREKKKSMLILLPGSSSDQLLRIDNIKIFLQDNRLPDFRTDRESPDVVDVTIDADIPSSYSASLRENVVSISVKFVNDAVATKVLSPNDWHRIGAYIAHGKPWLTEKWPVQIRKSAIVLREDQPIPPNASGSTVFRFSNHARHADALIAQQFRQWVGEVAFQPMEHPVIKKRPSITAKEKSAEKKHRITNGNEDLKHEDFGWRSSESPKIENKKNEWGRRSERQKNESHGWQGNSQRADGYVNWDD